MIEIEAEGTIVVEQEYSHSGEDGRADYSVTNKVRKEIEVDACKTFPDGYVNLEGYAYSVYPHLKEDAVYDFCLDGNPAIENCTILRDRCDLAVRMRGTEGDWIAQGVRYITERPADSLLGVLINFRNWAETNTSVLSAAIDTANTVPYADVKMGDMTDTKWNTMLQKLDDRCESDTEDYLQEQYGR